MAGDPNDVAVTMTLEGTEDTVNDVVYGVVEEYTPPEMIEYYTTPYVAKDKGTCEQKKVCFDLMKSCNCFTSGMCHAVVCSDILLYSICHCGWREEP